MKRAITALLSAFALAVAFEAPADAHEFYYFLGDPIRWDNDRATMRTSAVSFPSGTQRNALVEALNSWNSSPSQFRFSVTHGDTSVGLYNFQNEVWFSSQQYLLNGALGVAYNWNIGSKWVESDVLFNSLEPWSYGNSKTQFKAYFGSRWPFKAVAIHELGHSLGLDHEPGTYNVMGDATNCLATNGSSARAYPGEDAGDGAVDLYGLSSSAGQDVGVVHWKYDGSYGDGYSAHTRSWVRSQSGGELPKFGDFKYNPNGEWGYEVERGQTVRLELSFENNGRSTQKPQVGYYVSTNDTITTYDRLLVTASPTLGRNTVYQRTQTLTIPSDLTVGSTYYLGAVVDRNGAIQETRENNNASYVAIKIVD